jgi:hypothetical protein
MNMKDLTPAQIDHAAPDGQDATASKQPYVAPQLENLGDYAIHIGQAVSLPVNP